jgi:uncharacterized membrane protein YeaQ/YmgE (transglycosylase-associated protein family)
MNLDRLAIFLATGALAGWLAGKIMRGGGFGILGNIVVGIVGASIGGHLFGWLGIGMGGGWIGLIVKSTVGAMALLFAIRLIKSV